MAAATTTAEIDHADVVIRRNMDQSIVFMFWLDAESSEILAVRTKKELQRGKKRKKEMRVPQSQKEKALIKAAYCPWL